MSLSRTSPEDFNLDVERMFWAPFTGLPVTFDEFDDMSLFFGHSEFRVEPCVGSFSSLPTMTGSGLSRTFDRNYVSNTTPPATASRSRGPTRPSSRSR